MLAYSIIMFLAGALVAGLGLAIYRGKTDLIHSYHQTKVTDPAAYGKAFGKAMFVIAAALARQSGGPHLFPGGGGPDGRPGHWHWLHHCRPAQIQQGDLLNPPTEMIL